MDLVSIIVPVYNTGKYLKKCISSILYSTYENIEIIIINDGSTDDSKQILDKYKNNKKIKIVNQTNRGVSSARNTGLQMAKGKYVVFVDGDDYIDSHMIAKLVELMENNDIQLGACSYYKIYKNKKILYQLKENGVYNREELYDLLLKDNSIHGYLWNKIFLREIILQNNLKFDSNIDICEDLLFCFEYAEYTKKIKIINEHLYYYRMRKGSALNLKKDIKPTHFEAFKKIKKISEKSFYNNQSLYIYLYFKDYNKNINLDNLPKISLLYLIKYSEMTLKQKCICIFNKYIPNFIKIKIKNSSKENYYE